MSYFRDDIEHIVPSTAVQRFDKPHDEVGPAELTKKQ